MAKKAYLVKFDLMTREIANTEEEAIQKAIKKIRNNISDYITEESISEVIVDNEVPYNGKE